MNVLDIEGYYEKVTEYVLEEKSGDAAVNIRHIIESIIGYYTEKHAPEWIYAKQVEKIEQLHNIEFLDDFSTNTLHQLRKLANKGAHGEDVSTEEINKAIYPLRKIMDNFYIYLQKEGNASIDIAESKKCSWELVNNMFDKASLEEDYQQIINLLSTYEETEDILRYICKCKERIKELLSIRKEKEERIYKARKKLEFVDNKVFFYAGKFYALNIYGIETYYNLDQNDLTKALLWKDRKSWLAIGDNIFVIFNNGKVGTISKGKSQYIKHYKYGEWDDIQQLAVSNSWDEMNVYGLTEDGRIRVENIQKDSGYRSRTYDAKDYFYYQVEEWTDIEKIKCTKDYVYGIKKNGTIEVSGRYAKYGCDKWSDIIDVFCVGDIDVIGLKKDGTLIYSGTRDYMESICKWNDIIKVATSEYHALGLRADGTVIFAKSNNVNVDKHCCDVEAWTNIIDIWAGENISIGLREDGTILSCGKGADKYRMRICYNIFNYQEEYTIYSDIKSCIEKRNELEKCKKNLVKKMKKNQMDSKKQKRFGKSLCENENQLKKEIEKLEMEILDVDNEISKLEDRFDKMKVCSSIL